MPFAILFLAATSASAASLTVDPSNSPFPVSSDATFDSLTVLNGGTIVVDATLTIVGDATIEQGGIVTHTAKDRDMRLVVGGVLTVASGAFVDANAKGFGGGNNTGIGDHGETLDPVTLLPVSGAAAFVGGSHGGRGGGASPLAFGTQVAPITFGGGGGGGSCGSKGGRGGGHLFLQGATVRIDGLVRADGEAAAGGGCGAGGGGGAGGSIDIEAGTWSGGGTITAVGGNGGAAGGSGGRIYVAFTTRTYNGGMSALGGGGSSPGAAGTGYLISSTNALTAQGGLVQLDAGASFASLTLGAAGGANIEGAAVVTAPISVPAGATVILDATDALDAITINSPIGGTLKITAPAQWPTALTLSGGTLVVDDELDVNGDLTLNAASVLTHDPGAVNAFLAVTGTLNVKAGAFIDVNGKGFNNQSLDPTTLQLTTTPGFNGGAHGGVGGGSALRAYDDPRNPALLGSGGGTGSCGSAGGAGGGHIAITAATLRVDGIVRADGNDAAGGGCGSSGGGGAGGALFAQVSTFTGGGVVEAKGGAGAFPGGGGRIAVFYATNTFTGVVTALAASNANGAGDGSVWLEDGAAHLIAQGGVLALGAGDSFASVTMRPAGTLVVDGAAAVASPVTVAAGSTLKVESSDALSSFAFTSPVAGTLVVDVPLSIPSFSPALVVGGAAVLVINDAVDVAGNLTVQLSGKITHAAAADDFALTVAGTLDVQTGGVIDVTGLGLAQGPSAGFGGAGATISPVSLQVVAGSDAFTGGSHGGRGGGSSAATYDDPDAPIYLGGGGGQGSCGSQGGRGGGKLALDAGSLVVNGQILASGTGAAGGGCGAGGGGGAGGTIAIRATSLSGGGNIVADGGPGGAGGGGGGRVRVDVQNNTFNGLLRAAGGGGSAAGEAGTINVVDSADRTLVVAGGTYVIDEADTFTTITLGAAGNLVIAGAAHVDNAIVIGAGAQVTIASSSALDDIILSPNIAGTLRIDQPINVPTDVVLTGVLVVNNTLLLPSLDAKNLSVITHSPGVTAMNLVVSDVLDLEQGAKITANALGLAQGPSAGFGALGATIDPVTLQVVAGSGTFNGGSHVAVGGRGSNNDAIAASFDSATNPVYAGGGGGQGSCGSQGGAGGGVLRFGAGTFINDGIVSADGNPANGGGCGNGGGGGAGGTVAMSLGVWSGSTGVVFARGGNGGAGGGAGGVVVASYASKSFAGNIVVTGGSGAVAAGAAGNSTEDVVSEAPQIVSTPPVASQVGRLFRYRPVATGSPPLTWSLTQAPTGASIDANTGEVLWLPPDTQPANFRVHVQNALGSDEQAFIAQPTSAPFINSTPSTTAVAGAFYHYDADDRAAADGTGPITWASTTTPLGFTIDASTGTVTWQPQTPGTDPVCITATNSIGASTQCFNVVVTAAVGSQPPHITSTATLVGFIGVPYQYDDDATPATVDADGDPDIRFDALLAPDGFGIDPTTGIVAWTPTAAGAQGVCVVASNNSGEDTQCFTVDVQLAGPAIFTSTPATLAVQGSPYAYDSDGAVSASGPPPITFSAPTAPTGFLVDASTGVVTWTPADAGNFDVVIRAHNDFGDTDEAFTVTVLPTGAGSAPVILHTANGFAAVGLPYVYDDDGTAEAGGDAPITWSLGGGAAAPAGFHVEADSGLVTWTPTDAQASSAAGGPQTITLHAENQVGSDDYTFTVDVAATAGPEPTPVIDLAPRTGDAPLTVTADGTQSFAPPGDNIVFYRWTFGDGTAQEATSSTTHVYERAGSFVARLRVSDAVGASAEGSAIVSVLDDGVRPPAARILVSNLSGSDNLQVSFSCDCSNGDAPIEAFLWDFGDGERSDLAAVTHSFGPGGYEVRLSVVDANGLTATDAVQVRVADGENQPPVVSASALPVFGAAPLDTQFVASFGDVDGTVASVAWDFGEGGTATEPAPHYTYTTPGTYLATVTVTDDLGLSSTASVEIEVGDANGVRPPQILSLPVLTAAVGVAYSYDEDGLPAARGDRPLTWSLGKNVGGTVVGAPAGMTVDPATGAITWTPIAAQSGSVPVTLVAKNDAAAVAQDFQIDVGGGGGPDKPPPAASGCGCSSDDGTGGGGAPMSVALMVLALAGLAGLGRARRRLTRGAARETLRDPVARASPEPGTTSRARR